MAPPVENLCLEGPEFSGEGVGDRILPPGSVVTPPPGCPYEGISRLQARPLPLLLAAGEGEAGESLGCQAFPSLGRGVAPPAWCFREQCRAWTQDPRATSTVSSGRQGLLHLSPTQCLPHGWGSGDTCGTSEEVRKDLGNIQAGEETEREREREGGRRPGDGAELGIGMQRWGRAGSGGKGRGIQTPVG